MSSVSAEVGTTARVAAPGNLDSLTGVRFLAAMTIALGHSYAPLDEITMIGMPLFFTLSGFIIHYVYSDTFTSGWRSAAIRFAGARFSRIYPLYFIFLLVAAVLTPMGSILYHSANIHLVLAYLFACYTWLPLAVDGHATTNWYYDISWSVPTEIFFYIGYALVFYRLARIRSAKRCLGILVGFCLFAYLMFYTLFLTRDIWEGFALHHISGFLPRTTSFNDSLYRWFLYSSPYGRVFEFIGGCLTCQLFLLVRDDSRLRARLNFEVLAWLPCAMIIAIVAVYQQIAPYQHWLDPHDYRFLSFFVSLHMNFLLAPFCYVLIFALAYGPSTLSRLLSCGAVVVLGEISYSTYLGHPLAQSFVGNSALGHLRYASLIVEMVVIYLFSWMFYTALEVPAKAGLRRFFALHPGRAIADFLGPGVTQVTAAIGASIVAALFVHGLMGGEGGGKAEASGQTSAATIGDLPELRAMGALDPRWDGVNGLVVTRLDAPAVTAEDPLRLVVATGDSRHRLGLAVHGIDPDQVYRVSAWLKVSAPVHVLIDMRDARTTHYGTAVFDLPDAAKLHTAGDVVAPWIRPEANGWVRISGDMTFSGDVAVVYVTLLDGTDKDHFAGDGKTVVAFGGLDIARRE